MATSERETRQMTAVAFWIGGYIQAWQAAGRSLSELEPDRLWAETTAALRDQTTKNEFCAFAKFLLANTAG